MSQDTFPFAEGEEHEPYIEEAHSNRRAIMVVGGAAAALVVAAGGWFLLSGSGGSAAADSAFVPHGTVRHVAVGSRTPALSTTLPAAYTATLGRDPFKALYVVPAAAANPATGTTTSTAAVPLTGNGSASTSTTSGGSTPVTTASGGTTPTGSSTSTTGVSSARYTLKLLAISKPSPQARYSSWNVDSVTHTVLPGERFGKFGEIVVLAFTENSAGTITGAVIQVGDDSPVDVAIGQSISVL